MLSCGQSGNLRRSASKGCIASQPLSTDRDAPAPIPMVVRIVWVSATLNHPLPGVVEGLARSLPSTGCSHLGMSERIGAVSGSVVGASTGDAVEVSS